jgi:hypothetical protein
MHALQDDAPGPQQHVLSDDDRGFRNILSVNGIITPLERVEAMGVMVQDYAAGPDIGMGSDLDPFHRPQAAVADPRSVADPKLRTVARRQAAGRVASDPVDAVPTDHVDIIADFDPG